MKSTGQVGCFSDRNSSNICFVTDWNSWIVLMSSCLLTNINFSTKTDDCRIILEVFFSFFFFFEFLWKSWGINLKILLGFFWNSSRIILEFFSNYFEILLKFFWNSSGILLELSWNSSGILLEFFWNSSGILLKFFWNSFGTLLEFFWHSSGILREFFKHSASANGINQFENWPMKNQN